MAGGQQMICVKKWKPNVWLETAKKSTLKDSCPLRRPLLAAPVVADVVDGADGGQVNSSGRHLHAALLAVTVGVLAVVLTPLVLPLFTAATRPPVKLLLPLAARARRVAFSRTVLGVGRTSTPFDDVADNRWPAAPIKIINHLDTLCAGSISLNLSTWLTITRITLNCAVAVLCPQSIKIIKIITRDTCNASAESKH